MILKLKKIIRRITGQWDVVGFVNEPDQIIAVGDGSVRFRGWAFSKQGLKVVVRVLSNQQVVYSGVAGMRREDVAQKYPQFAASHFCGFSFAIESRWFYSFPFHKLLIEAGTSRQKRVIGIVRLVREPLMQDVVQAARALPRQGFVYLVQARQDNLAQCRAFCRFVSDAGSAYDRCLCYTYQAEAATGVLPLSREQDVKALRRQMLANRAGSARYYVVHIPDIRAVQAPYGDVLARMRDAAAAYPGQVVVLGKEASVLPKALSHAQLVLPLNFFANLLDLDTHRQKTPHIGRRLAAYLADFTGRMVVVPEKSASQPAVRYHVDEVKYLVSSNSVGVKGWAIGQKAPISRITVVINNRVFIDLPHKERSDDIFRLFPQYLGSAVCRFDGTVALPAAIDNRTSVLAVYLRLETEAKDVVTSKTFQVCRPYVEARIDSPREALFVYSQIMFRGILSYRGGRKPDVGFLLNHKPVDDKNLCLQTTAATELQDDTCLQPFFGCLRLPDLKEDNLSLALNARFGDGDEKVLQQVNLNNRKPLVDGAWITVDTPAPGQIIRQNIVEVKGFAYITTGCIKEIQVFLNECHMGNARYFLKRDDVLMGSSGEFQAVYTGFSLHVPLLAGQDNLYKLKIRAICHNGRHFDLPKIPFLLKGNPLPLVSNLYQPPRPVKQILAYLDAPKSSAAFFSHHLAIEGWCFSKVGDIEAIDIHVDGKLIMTTRPDLDRFDVAEAYQDITPASRCGFSALLDTGSFTADRVVLEVVVHDTLGNDEILGPLIVQRIHDEQPIETDKVYQLWRQNNRLVGGGPGRQLRPCLTVCVLAPPSTAPGAYANTLQSLDAFAPVIARVYVKQPLPHGMQCAAGVPVPAEGEGFSCLQSLPADSLILFIRAGDCLLPDHAQRVMTALCQLDTAVDFVYFDEESQASGTAAPVFKPGPSPLLLLHRYYLGKACIARRTLFPIGEITDASLLEPCFMAAFFAARRVAHRCFPLLRARAGDMEDKHLAEALKQITKNQLPGPDGYELSLAGSPYSRAYPLWRVDIKEPASPPDAMALCLDLGDTQADLSRIGPVLEKITGTLPVYALCRQDAPVPECLARAEVKVLRVPCEEKNKAAFLNAGIRHIPCAYIILLDACTLFTTSLPIKRYQLWTRFKDIAAVGIKVLFPDDRVECAGFIVNRAEAPLTYAFQYHRNNGSGYLDLLSAPREVSGVKLNGMMIRRDAFQAVGGFDEQSLKKAYLDADVCMKLRAAGQRVIYDPCIEAYDVQSSASRFTPFPKQAYIFKQRWPQADAYYNANLSQQGLSYLLSAERNPACNTESRINVLVLMPDLHIGGSQIFILNLAEGLARNNVRFDVLAVKGGKLKDRFAALGQVHVMAEHTNMPMSDNLLQLVENYRGLDAFFNGNRCDVVLANTIDSFFAVNLAKRYGKPCFWVIHESVDPYVYFQERGAAVAKQGALALDGCSRFVFVSQATRDLFRRTVAMRSSTVIPNGIHFAPIDRFMQENRLELRNRHGITENACVILSLGTICPRKAQHILLQAAGRCTALDRRFIIYLIGGRQTDYLDYIKCVKEQVPVDVRLVDETTDIFAYLHMADLFVVSSYEESYPLNILEAMAFGKCIITTPVFGIQEIVSHGVNGLVFPPGHTERLALHMQRVVQDGPLRHTLAENAYYHVRVHNDAADMAGRYLCLMNSLISR